MSSRFGVGPRSALLALSAVAAPLAAQSAEVQAFVEEAEAKLLDLAIEAQRADWVKSTFITDDTEQLAARANQRLIEANVDFAKRAARFDPKLGAKDDVPPELRRKLLLLKLAIALPAPSDTKLAAELTQITARMEGAYGKGKWTRTGKDSKALDLDITELTRLFASSRDASELRDAWAGWHAVGAPMRADFFRYVDLCNQGARELGFADMGAFWRAKYDMTPDAFAAEVDRLWEQVKPFYLSLHAYVRHRLHEKYGDLVPANGPIPAHLLGNMWAQEWGNVYDLVAPKGAGAGIDLTALLRAHKVDERGMVKYGEGFFTSLGFPKLPDSFWQSSMFTKPCGREVVCHASAWDIDFAHDLRIKMCIDVTGDDFRTIHHELGHNFYQRAYEHQPFLYRDSANDGFHEAIGDTVALSITPAYLKTLGLLDQEPDASADIGLLLQQALDKIAFLPFGLVIDQWRWKVFSGEIPKDQANAEWWKLRLEYQGIAPPLPRSEADFDACAKYHVPANVAYTRYFLAHILQFQFHRALCKIAGTTGPLHRQSIYGNAAAGAALQKMLEMGVSRPWPDALEAMTGQREIDGGAILDYFAPLKQWLDEQNRGQPVGW